MTQVVNSGTGGLLSTLSKFSTTTKRNSGIGSRHTERNREPVSLKPDWRLGTRCSEHVAKEYEKYTWWGKVLRRGRRALLEGRKLRMSERRPCRPWYGIAS